MGIEPGFQTALLRTGPDPTLADVARVEDPRAERVRAHMSPDPWGVPEDWNARQIAVRMINHGIRHAPVLRDGKVVGVVSSLDLVAGIALGETGSPPDPAP